MYNKILSQMDQQDIKLENLIKKNARYLKNLNAGKIRKLRRIMIHQNGSKQEITTDGRILDLSEKADSDVESHLTFESYFVYQSNEYADYNI